MRQSKTAIEDALSKDKSAHRERSSNEQGSGVDVAQLEQARSEANVLRTHKVLKPLRQYQFAVTHMYDLQAELITGVAHGLHGRKSDVNFPFEQVRREMLLHAQNAARSKAAFLAAMKAMRRGVLVLKELAQHPRTDVRLRFTDADKVTIDRYKEMFESYHASGKYTLAAADKVRRVRRLQKSRHVQFEEPALEKAESRRFWDRGHVEAIAAEALARWHRDVRDFDVLHMMNTLRVAEVQ